MQRPELDTNSLNVPDSPPPRANFSHISKKRKITEGQKENSVLTKNTRFVIAAGKIVFKNMGRFLVNSYAKGQTSYYRYQTRERERERE